MKHIIQFIIIAVSCFALTSSAGAIGGTIVKKAGMEVGENIFKIFARGDSTVTRSQIDKHVIDVAKKCPAIEKFHIRHGKDTMYVVKSDERVAIFAKYGDDAGKALISHDQAAYRALALADGLGFQAGKSTARIIPKLSRINTRELAFFINKQNITPKNSAAMLGYISRQGDRAVDLIKKRPFLMGGVASVASLGVWSYASGVIDPAMIMDAGAFVVSYCWYILTTIIVLVTLSCVWFARRKCKIS